MMKETKCPFLDHIFDSFFIYSHIHLVVMYGVVPHWISTNLMGTKLGKFSISKSLRELRSERKSPTAKKMIFLPLLLPLTTFPVYCVDHLQILFFILLSSLTSCSIEFNYLIFPLINDKKILLLLRSSWEDSFCIYSNDICHFHQINFFPWDFSSFKKIHKFLKRTSLLLWQTFNDMKSHFHN